MVQPDARLQGGRYAGRARSIFLAATLTCADRRSWVIVRQEPYASLIELGSLVRNARSVELTDEDPPPSTRAYCSRGHPLRRPQDGGQGAFSAAGQIRLPR